MKRYIAAVLALAIAQCATEGPAIAANPVIGLSPTNLALCVSSSKNFTATISGGGNATFNETASSDANATISPTSIPSLRNGAVSTYTLTAKSNPTASGSATVNLREGTSVDDSKNLTYTVDGPITVTTPATATLNLSVGGSTGSFTIADPGPSETVAAVSDNTNVATVTPSQPTSGGSASFTVTPGTQAGTAHISLTGNSSSCSAPSAVTVNVTGGPLTLTKTSFDLDKGGAAGTTTASETGYTGAISVSPGPNTLVATVSPSSGTGPSVTFTVTPVNFGSTSFTVNDNHGGSKQVTVLVSGGQIGFSGGSTFAFSPTDNTNAHFPATQSLSVTGAVQTTSSGSASVYVLPPGNIAGTNGGTLPISALTYTCTNNGGGGTFTAGFLSLQASLAGPNCITVPSNTAATLNFNLNFFLDDRAIPADSYHGTNFQLVLSAT